MKKCLLFILVLISFGFITSCASNLSPNTYESAEVGVVSKVVPGVVIAKRAVKIDANTGVGGLTGAAGGAAGGSAIGGSSRSNIAGAIGGAVVGGLVGNAVEKAIHGGKGFEYIIKLKTGCTISVVQRDDVQFQINQRVLVIYGAMTRIIPDDTAEHSGK